MLKRIINFLFSRRPAHIGWEEHPVGSMPGCPGCDHQQEKMKHRRRSA